MSTETFQSKPHTFSENENNAFKHNTIVEASLSILLIVSFFIVALRSGTNIITGSKFSQIQSIHSQSTLTIKTHVDNLCPENKQLLINGNMVLYNPINSLTRLFDAELIIARYKDGTKISSETSKKQYNVTFHDELENSDNFVIYNEQVTTFDAVEIVITLIGNLQNVKGVNTSFKYTNPKPESVTETVVFVTGILTLITAFNLILKINNSKSEDNEENEIIILTSSTVMTAAGHFICYYFLNRDFSKLIDAIVLIIFLSVFRIISAHRLFTMFKDKLPEYYIYIIDSILALFTIYENIFIAKNVILPFAYPNPKTKDMISISLHAAISLTAIIGSLYYIHSSPANAKIAVITNIIFIIFAAIVSILSQVVFPYISLFEGSFVPSFFFYTSHFILANSIIYSYNPILYQKTPHALERL